MLKYCKRNIEDYTKIIIENSTHNHWEILEIQENKKIENISYEQL